MIVHRCDGCKTELKSLRRLEVSHTSEEVCSGHATVELCESCFKRAFFSIGILSDVKKMLVDGPKHNAMPIDVGGIDTDVS